jgi:hypothetical protein
VTQEMETKEETLKCNKPKRSDAQLLR